jgi:hypothetical protein
MLQRFRAVLPSQPKTPGQTQAHQLPAQTKPRFNPRIHTGLDL